MNAVYDDVVKLVDKELESANKKFPLFRSAHEGYAVILEEVDEAREEVEDMNGLVDFLWKAVKVDSEVENFLVGIQIKAEALACEAIQVAAMAKKFQESMEKFNG